MAQLPQSIDANQIDEKKVDSVDEVTEERSQSRTSLKMSTNLSKTRSKSRSKSKPKSNNLEASVSTNLKHSKCKIHSSDIHVGSHTIVDNEEEEIHPFVRGLVPAKEPTVETDPNESMQRKKMMLLTSMLNFRSGDNNKSIMEDDICLHVINVRNIMNCLSANKNDIVNLKLRQKMIQFTFKRKYHVFIRLLSKNEMNQLPQWSKNSNTKAVLVFGFEKFKMLGKQNISTQFALYKIFLRIDCFVEIKGDAAQVQFATFQHQYQTILNFLLNDKERCKAWLDIRRCLHYLILSSVANKSYIYQQKIEKK